MYRLCRLFISDITAGENLLRNGFVPVFRENGLADHGVLFAANGTCKTTLLSFILNVFCPDQRRFVQHLQSGGDKTLEQYLIPGRPAVILLDMATLLQPNLFEEEPVEHLVLGQLLYRHRTAPDKTDRTYFIAQSADFFDLLRRQWDELLRLEQPYRTVRDFMASRIQQTTSQKEWADTLERLGLDPWLIDRQIDFARTEGGIKDAFKFRSETEFMSFFLGCVADMDAAATLRETIGQSLRKMEDRPRKIAQLRAARDLKEQIAEFDGIARKWRNACAAVETWTARLGEAAHLLHEADAAAAQKVETLEPGLEAAKLEREDAHAKMNVAEANGLAVQRFQLVQAIATAEGDIKTAEAEIEKRQAEDKAVRAAGDLAELRKKRAEADIKEEALRQAAEEMAPMMRKIDGLAAQYHVRLDDDRRRVREEIALLTSRQAAAERSENEASDRRTAGLAELEALNEKINKITSRIQEARAGRTALPMEPGESPLNALDRLTDAVRGIEGRMVEARERMTVLEEEGRAGQSQWRRLQKDRSDLESRLDRAKGRMEAEATARRRLLADDRLKRAAGTDAFEPASAELVSRLDDVIGRSRDRLTDKQRTRLVLDGDLERLEQTETLAADPQTQRLIAHYYSQGLTPGELKSFPEYLANLYDAPEEIAEFIEGDPGRFTGIMAANEEVIARVLDLPVPEWLHRPVIISRPCPSEEVTPADQAVIRPPNPDVYSKQRMEETKARLMEQREALDREIADDAAELREMERSSRALHAYRESYPDRAAVAALSDRVGELETALSALSGEIEDAEVAAEDLRERKSGQEDLLRTLGSDLTLHKERLNQVEKWLGRYADLETWQQEKEAMAPVKADLEKRLRADDAALGKIREEIGRLRGDIRVQQARLQELDDKAGDVPPGGGSLSAKERKSALEMDLRTLHGLYNSARDDQRQMANELGVDALRKELDALRNDLARLEARFEAFGRDNPYDAETADAWAGQSASEREKRREELAAGMETLRGDVIRMTSRIDYQREEIRRLNEELAARAHKDIMPSVSEGDIEDEDLDGMLHRFNSERDRHAEVYARMTARCRKLEETLKAAEQWRQEIQLGMAETRTFPPVWDGRSPRVQWPNLLSVSDDDARIGAVQSLRDQVKEMMAAEGEDRRAVEASRRKMSGAYDRLQADLLDETYRSHLPAVVDELRRHDAESLGAQGRDLVQRCEDIARNIESDLEISQRIVDNLVNMLLQRSREYHQKLQQAAQETLPEDVYIYGGKPILRAGSRLDFAKHGDAFRQSVENWLYELIQQDRLPEVNPRAGNCLGSELLYQLLESATGKKSFGVRLLKCDDTGRNYEPVGKDLGSGGEALTTAVLLYTLLISMRKKRRSQTDDRIPAFLVLDNPLGVCNRSDFLDAQLKVARAMGIQCVYLTGINDRESLDLFELRVAIRKGEKKLEIENVTYDCLEVTELNVEKRHGPYLA